ncbi:DUF6580 family putative transport protein [Paracidobacterium acidisoli]|uniref:Uncharacterized protein n=1 Tax=Paracidobacterium acidisoli TaxID=2303751 RepID=A0A372ILT2_9BACT|nr:DUF6580 family putative transport protein [Paracidobacterium acidisoli]MBT9332506.1 hypothetical protein [Paracidobacterium acidisoli]
MSAYLLVVLAVLSRVIPHEWLNFTAVGGSLLFFGARRPLRQAMWPVLALMATDYYLTVYAYNYPFHTSSYLVTWVWYAAVVVLGHILLAKKVSAGRVAGAVALSSTSFFVVSNYAVWIGSVATMYPHTLAGLAACYTAAMPFYRNDLLSTALVAGLAFGLPAMARKMSAGHEAQSKLSV